MPRGGHSRLEHVGLKPLVEEVDGAHGHELDFDRIWPGRRVPESAFRGRAASMSRRGLSDVGSGGTMARLGFTKRHMACMACRIPRRLRRRAWSAGNFAAGNLPWS